MPSASETTRSTVSAWEGTPIPSNRTTMVVFLDHVGKTLVTVASNAKTSHDG